MQPERKAMNKDFLPLLTIGAAIIICTAATSMIFGQYDLATIMSNFMGFFFLIFGLFKISNLTKFATAYAEYDIIAQRFFWYGYLYPCLELILATAYLTRSYPLVTNICTLALMMISAWGVFLELRKGRQIACACLGTVFKIPMTWVTLVEDLLMAFMALIMILAR